MSLKSYKDKNKGLETFSALHSQAFTSKTDDTINTRSHAVKKPKVVANRNIGMHDNASLKLGSVDEDTDEEDDESSEDLNMQQVAARNSKVVQQKRQLPQAASRAAVGKQPPPAPRIEVMNVNKAQAAKRPSIATVMT